MPRVSERVPLTLVNISENINGELQFNGTLGLRTISQTVPIPSYPCALFFNPDNDNIYALELNIPSNWKLMEIYSGR